MNQAAKRTIRAAIVTGLEDARVAGLTKPHDIALNIVAELERIIATHGQLRVAWSDKGRFYREGR